MALILAGTAAYAAYRAMSEEEVPLDPDVPNLETLESVSLLPIELALGLTEAPIHTISFFNGKSEDIAEKIEKRVKAIIKINPWLGGWMYNENKQLKLFYDASGEKSTPGAFRVFEPGKISLSKDTPYVEYESILNETGTKVPKNQDLIGKNEALWRISVIPDSEAPNDRFALVASMSHIAGDACVFYELYKMLSTGAEIVALNPQRHQEVVKQAEGKMGDEEMAYVTKAISNRLWEFAQPQEEDPVQSCIFYISQEWLERQRGGHEDGELQVSDHALLASTFFVVARPTIAFNIRQLRGQVSNVTNKDAGNYQVSIPYTEYDYGSPELIEKSHKTLRRCGEFHRAQLPFGSWNQTYSVMTNWSSFYETPIQLGDGLTELSHLPLYSAAEMTDIPSNLSLFCIFTASQKQDDESHKKRIGASIVAPQSVIRALEASGIVGEPVSKS